MAQITAALVKDLREKSGAGMMDCKKALTEANGDVEAAVDWLRKKGLAAAAKKAGRVAAEGLVGVAVSEKEGAVVEINSETDFVSKNDIFQGFVGEVSEIALKSTGEVEDLKEAQYPTSGKKVSDQLTDMIAKIGENMNIRRSAKLSVENGIVVSYVHNKTAANLGKIGVLVALESGADKAELNAIGQQVAMHIAASNPLYLDVADVDAEALKREKDVLADQARASGKPENIIEKMMEGRIRKYYEQVCLLKQAFVMDTDKNVEKAITDACPGTKVTGYVRFELGDGIEKKEEDFAAEVAAQVNK